MIIPLLLQKGIIPICTVRKEDQADILRKIMPKKLTNCVVNTALPNYMQTMKALCIKFKPSTCLESVSGDMTGHVLELMTFKSTVILYGLLSDKPAGGINTIGFIGKN